jgi:hypothetical protein
MYIRKLLRKAEVTKFKDKKGGIAQVYEEHCAIPPC